MQSKNAELIETGQSVSYKGLELGQGRLGRSWSESTNEPAVGW